MNETWDVVIVGAGIVGSACALECASRGLRTAVVEGKELGGGATAAGMGHIVVMDDSPAQMALTQYSQTLWQDLSQAVFRPTWNTNSAERCGWQATKRRWRRFAARVRCTLRLVFDTEILDGKMLADAEPHLRQPLAGALLVPSDAVLYPPCAAGYLLREALRLGAQLYSRRTHFRHMAGEVRLDDGRRCTRRVL